MAYIFIYLDAVVDQPEAGSGMTSPGARFILILIAIYGTSQMLVKLILAYIHQIGWMLTNCCQGQMEKGRLEKINKCWTILNEQYTTVMKEVLVGERHSKIIRKKPKSKPAI